MFLWFKKNKFPPTAGIPSISTSKNHWFQQLFSEQNLDTAHAGLLEHSAEQDHSDVRDYAQHWSVNKPRLQQHLQDGTFRFQPVREVEISDEQGRISRREIRCAEDRLLIRAIAQVLKPLFGDALSKDCVHLAGNGGLKATVAQVGDYIAQHPNHQVIKSDVKGYYANIDHTVLNEQFQQLLPNEPRLHTLLWNFMRRTVEFGGNYRDVEMGLPLGASLSPLLGALYLSPLDALAKNTPDTFYRRYMDDWVWVLPKKRDLRKALKQQYGVLQTLRVAMHPDKTYIGHVKKGFDFLGFHLSPTGVTVSDAALSRHEEKVARLYERGASKQRIWAYRLRWLAWVGGAISAAYAAPGTGPSFNIGPDCQAFSSGHELFPFQYLVLFDRNFTGGITMPITSNARLEGHRNCGIDIGSGDCTVSGWELVA